MGESKLVSTARLCAAVTAGLAATALLASCAGVGATPGAAAPVESASSSASPSGDAPVPAPTESVVVVTPTATAAAMDKRVVVPFVTSAVWNSAADRLDVSAIVPEIVESGGTCTLTAVRGDATVTAEGPAAPAASYTGCSQLAIDGAELGAGEWQVQVSYASDESAGASAAQPVTAG